MSDHAAAVEVEPSLMGPAWRKVMMWIFIITDGLLFAGFLAAYGFNRLAADVWPDPNKVFSMNFITLMTFTLITSSATMACGVAAARKGQMKQAGTWVLLTAIGGFAFLNMQAIEWWELIHSGATLTSLPKGAEGPVTFSQFFFMMTGFHGTHVLLGVIILLVTMFRVRAGKTTGEGVELAGLYWHFVDLVWVFIFGLFYLI